VGIGSESAMPRYFFHLVSPDRAVRDENGVELDGLSAAHWHAVKLTFQIRYFLPDDDDDWVIEISDEAGGTPLVFLPSFKLRH
jgi:hypothetical protein